MQEIPCPAAYSVPEITQSIAIELDIWDGQNNPCPLTVIPALLEQGV
jgi:hypothetical protein